MIKKKIFFLAIFILVFSLYINYFSGYVGILPIDSFAFFDTGYLVLQGYHPFKDFWITTGFLVDYFQAFFFKVWGLGWGSYVLHAAFLNCIFALSLFIYFIKNNLNIYISSLYAISASILFYPTIGTPFAYHHSYFFSVLSILLLSLIIKKSSNLLWFFLPVSMLVSFLCMQTPAAYINLLILLFIVTIFLRQKNISNIVYFVLGSLTSLLVFFLYFKFTQVPLQSFIEQYILFPLTIGSDRITNSSNAYLTLDSKFSFKSIFGDFKFIHIIFIVLFYSIFIKFKLRINLKSDKIFEILILISIATFVFIFNQLVTANQIYIFSLIPLLAGFTNIGVNEYLKKKKYFSIFLIAVVLIATIKYHERFNVNRKFIDLENINLNKAVNGNKIDKKFNNLRWITKHHPNNITDEIKNINKTIQILREDKRNKMVISHYQIFSVILEENLNNPNRWYTSDGNSYPLENHKYFIFYKKFINNKIKDKEIDVIYLVDSSGNGGLKISNFKKYLHDICFMDEYIIKNVLSAHTIIKCTSK